MARGTIAKENVTNRIKSTFGNDYVTARDGKVYVWADDGGERVQIALSMTCPKTLVNAEEETPEVLDFSDPKPAVNLDFTADEKQNIADLMERLGL